MMIGSRKDDALIADIELASRVSHVVYTRRRFEFGTRQDVLQRFVEFPFPFFFNQTGVPQ